MYANKLLPHLFYPITIIMILTVCGLIRRRRLPVVLAFTILWLTTTPIISKFFISFIERDQLRKPLVDIRSADAVVVLSGMLTAVRSQKGPIYEWSDPDRYFAGLELMQAKKARYLIFTGGLFPWQTQLPSEGYYLAKIAKQAGLAENQIAVSEDVQNTAQEVVAVKKYLAKHRLKDIILVTSAYHMPRAEKLFTKAGIDLQTFPVDSKLALDDITPMDFLPNAETFASNQFLLRELAGRVYYSLY